MVLVSAALTAKDCPTEGKLILSLLGAKVHGKSLPPDDDAITSTVHECDLYGEKNPWEIWEAFGGGDIRNNNGSRELYIFSTIKNESSRLVRTIGLGSWEPHGKDVSILAQGGSQGTYQRVAVRKCLRFDNSGTHHDGAWIMHEFSLDPSFLSTPSANFNYVLCKLVKNEGNPIRFMRISTEEITMQEVTNNGPASTANNGGLSPIESENVQVQVEGGDDDKKNKVEEETTAEEEKRPIKSENGKLPQMVGDKKNKMEETTDEDNYEEHVDENLSWRQFFSTQLIEGNDKGAMKQEEECIELLPNRFARDLLLPLLNIKYFGISK